MRRKTPKAKLKIAINIFSALYVKYNFVFISVYRVVNFLEGIGFMTIGIGGSSVADEISFGLNDTRFKPALPKGTYSSITTIKIADVSSTQCLHH